MLDVNALRDKKIDYLPHLTVRQSHWSLVSIVYCHMRSVASSQMHEVIPSASVIDTVLRRLHPVQSHAPNSNTAVAVLQSLTP